MIYNTTIDIAEDSERFEATQFHVKCTKGSEFYWFIRVKVPKTAEVWDATIAATGNGARMHWRTALDAGSTILEASNTGSYLTVDETNPENLLITIHIPASVTKDIVFGTPSLGIAVPEFREGGRGVYDLEVVLDTGDVFRILEGTVTTSDEVTREA